MRFFLEISYDGSRYHGWQYQPNAISIQETIEKALGDLLGTKTPIVGSGRTDTGVHASCQIAHFDAENIDNEKLKFKLNSYLPREIAIHNIHSVTQEAHARFDAISRSYVYYMHLDKNPFKVGTSYYLRAPVSLSSVTAACTILLNWTDFEGMSKVNTDVNNFNCQITKAEWKEVEGGYVFLVQSNRFLRGMVRALVGTLLEVGTEKMSIDRFGEVLAAKNRAFSGVSVPASGLFLSKVEYPKDIYLN
ncbi:MAG: tRNA pseudouridine(38-40) synthase TruA [Flammeovirgaceae bacterium]|nr:tRNA pseudouridine(38-40) synthase TruA [Flammeovirgaceae bacterium]|tara:strand:+ start:2772 stop:3515 length:744 start_codon:yes stop_codon:yes gene_type:complete